MSEDEQSIQEFSWCAHPARERLGRAALGGLLILSLSILSGLMMQSLLWGVFAALLLVAVLNRFFFPSRFVIDAEGISAAYLLKKQSMCWSELRRFAMDRHGGYLSTRARRSWLDAYRGMHILFGRQRDAVIERILAHLSDGDNAWAR